MYDCAYDFLMNFKIILQFEPKTEERMMEKYYRELKRQFIFMFILSVR